MTNDELSLIAPPYEVRAGDQTMKAARASRYFWLFARVTRALRMRSWTLMLLIVSGTLAGCYNHKFQRSRPPAVVTGLIPGQNHVDVGVIEFDDMGELFDRCGLSPQNSQPCQLISVLEWIENQRAAAANEPEPENSVVVTFVHGWANNADPSNDDLRQFNDELDTLQNQASGVRYIGIYLGWRGSSWPGRNTIEYFPSVFNREAGARRVASVSATEVLFRISDAAKKQVTKKDGQQLKGKFILIGHSFGGLIVERTLAQALTAQIVLATDKESSRHSCEDNSVAAEPFADLAVLINPAIDAIETQQLIDMMKRSRFKTCPTNSGFEPPLLVSIKARNDSATGWIFTTAHFLESGNKVFRDYGSAPDLSSLYDPKRPSQWSVYKHTAGALDNFHNYCYVDDEGPGDKGCKRVTRAVKSETIGQKQGSGNTAESVAVQRPQVTSEHYRQAFAGSTPLKFGEVAPQLYTRYRGTCSYSYCDVWNNTPYWIFTVPKKVVNSHGGWNNPNFALLLTAIIQQTAANPSKGVGFQ
jgi:hypothetical protein